MRGAGHSHNDSIYPPPKGWGRHIRMYIYFDNCEMAEVQG